MNPNIISLNFKYNFQIYNSNPKIYNNNKINDLIYNKKKHLVSIFQDNLIYNDYSEFLNKYYFSYNIKQILKMLFNINKNRAIQNFINITINKIMLRNKTLKNNLNIKIISPNKSFINSINIKNSIESGSTTVKNSLIFPNIQIFNVNTLYLEYDNIEKEILKRKEQNEESILSFYSLEKNDYLKESKILNVIKKNLKHKKYINNNKKTIQKYLSNNTIKIKQKKEKYKTSNPNLKIIKKINLINSTRDKSYKKNDSQLFNKKASLIKNISEKNLKYNFSNCKKKNETNKKNIRKKLLEINTLKIKDDNQNNLINKHFEKIKENLWTSRKKNFLTSFIKRNFKNNNNLQLNLNSSNNLSHSQKKMSLLLTTKKNKKSETKYFRNNYSQTKKQHFIFNEFPKKEN